MQNRNLVSRKRSLVLNFFGVRTREVAARTVLCGGLLVRSCGLIEVMSIKIVTVVKTFDLTGGAEGPRTRAGPRKREGVLAMGIARFCAAQPFSWAYLAHVAEQLLWLRSRREFRPHTEAGSASGKLPKS